MTSIPDSARAVLESSALTHISVDRIAGVGPWGSQHQIDQAAGQQRTVQRLAHPGYVHLRP